MSDTSQIKETIRFYIKLCHSVKISQIKIEAIKTELINKTIDQRKINETIEILQKHLNDENLNVYDIYKEIDKIND